MYKHLHVLHFILYLNFTASMYDGKICLFSYGSGEINKQTHSWNALPTKRAFRAVVIYMDLYTTDNH